MHLKILYHDIKNSVIMPFSNAKGLLNLLAGILLNVVPVINFFAMGYLCECICSGYIKDFRLPKWEHIGKLFVRGLLLILITLIWSIPVLILFFSAARIFWPLYSAGIFIKPGMSAIGVFLLAFTLIIGLFLFYVMPSVIVNYAIKKRFAAGFQFKTIFKNAFSVRYLFRWILGALILYVFMTGAKYLKVIAIIPRTLYATSILHLIISSAALFISMLIIGTLIAQIYHEL